ncbi:type VI secretion system protein TssL, short form [Pseudomonas citronellolis]|uniref:type VI secretion system protein TssL, short form n=1 Tax=Pseudomonas citronellolis TaxID=53408 RepID=UPI0023E3EB40|nr:type VI secretion system protein TssL, short form [Pseudomonas citronellolis]MDF3933908.1 type VI secretion system protein TssL, short form [Pseudomonas citronellolis]
MNARLSSVADIDAVLQNTYLLVVELRQGASVQGSPNLWRHCTEQVENTRRNLEAAGVSLRSIDQICYAQCALLDETVLGHAKDAAHAAWAATPLQAHFFSRHQAGLQLYEDMREALAEPAPDRLVLTCYHRVLMLGFQGRYQGALAPEREQLIAALAERVEPFALGKDSAVLVRAAQPGWRRWFGTPWLHVVLAGLVLASLWWALNRSLVDAVGNLLPGST